MTTTAGAHEAQLQTLGDSFRRTQAAVRRLRGRETHNPDELSYAQYTVLFALAREGRELSAGELARVAELSAASVTQMLDSLAAAELVDRTRSVADRRVVLTSLTARGERLVAKRRAVFEAAWSDALGDFSAAELETAAAVMDRIGTLFEDLAEPR